MRICKQTMEELFSVGDSIPVDAALENALGIVAIADGHVRLQPALPAAEPIILAYSAISTAINAAAGAMGGEPADPSLRCFVAEYLRRAEDARRDAEVEAMWLSAGVCQIQ